MRALILTAALLSLLLLAPACESNGETRPEDDLGQSKDGETARLPSPDDPDYVAPVNLLSEPEREKLYFDLDQFTKGYWSAVEDNRAETWTYLHTVVLMPKVDANLDELIKASADASQQRRRRIATKSLGFTSLKQKATDALVPILEQNDVVLLVNTLLSLFILRNPETPLETTVLLLAHPEADVRVDAALVVYRVALARRRTGDLEIDEDLRTASGRLLLIVARKEEDPFVRAHAAAALGAIGDPMAVDVLINLLQEDQSVIRTRAAEGLGQIGEASAVPALIKALDRAEGPTEELLITASLEKIANDHGLPVNRKALGTDPEKWENWYEDIRRGPVPK